MPRRFCRCRPAQRRSSSRTSRARCRASRPPFTARPRRQSARRRRYGHERKDDGDAPDRGDPGSRRECRRASSARWARASATQSWPLDNTTPPADELQRTLAAMRDRGAQAVAMEVSSHALALGRVADVRVGVGVFTNLTRDHLDFHGSLDAYAAAKRTLFERAEHAVAERRRSVAARRGARSCVRRAARSRRSASTKAPTSSGRSVETLTRRQQLPSRRPPLRVAACRAVQRVERAGRDRDGARARRPR